jgi:hypothetical protein
MDVNDAQPNGFPEQKGISSVPVTTTVDHKLLGTRAVTRATSTSCLTGSPATTPLQALERGNAEDEVRSVHR